LTEVTVVLRQRPVEPGAKVALLRREVEPVAVGAVVIGGSRIRRVGIGRVLGVR
jgi:hypothetical protein